LDPSPFPPLSPFPPPPSWGREFDVVSNDYIGQTNVGKQVINKKWRDEARRTFEAAEATGRKPYFHFEKQPGSDLLKKIREFEARYDIKAVIDIGPLGE